VHGKKSGVLSKKYSPRNKKMYFPIFGFSSLVFFVSSTYLLPILLSTSMIGTVSGQPLASSSSSTHPNFENEDQRTIRVKREMIDNQSGELEEKRRRYILER
jgi:hypothetical protein